MSRVVLPMSYSKMKEAVPQRSQCFTLRSDSFPEGVGLQNAHREKNNVIFLVIYEPAHDKTYKMACTPSEA